VLVVPKEGSEAAISKLNELGEVAWLIGEVVESTGEQVII